MWLLLCGSFAQSSTAVDVVDAITGDNAPSIRVGVAVVLSASASVLDATLSASVTVVGFVVVVAVSLLRRALPESSSLRVFTSFSASVARCRSKHNDTLMCANDYLYECTNGRLPSDGRRR